MQDKDIVELFFQKDEKGILEVEKSYGAYCYSIISNILKNSEDIKECLNDTYNELWNSVPPAKPVSLKAYIGKVARNTALNKLTHNKALKRNGEFDILLSELADCADCANIENEVQARDVVHRIGTFLQGEPEEIRRIFIRRYWYGDSIKKIAMYFSLSESKVKSILFRTRNKLKLYLKKEVGYEQT